MIPNELPPHPVNEDDDDDDDNEDGDYVDGLH